MRGLLTVDGRLPGGEAAAWTPPLDPLDAFEAEADRAGRDAPHRAAIHAAIGPLEALVERWCPLRRAASLLEERLADPALAGHPKRPEAVERLAGIRERLAAVEADVEDELAAAEGAWRALSAEGRAGMARTGWPKAGSASGFAARLWRHAINRVEARTEEATA